MAVINAFVTNNIESKAADTCIAARFGGSIVRTVFFNFETLAADDNASIYRIARIPGTAIIKDLVIANDSIAGFTNPSVGIYKPLEVGGDVIDVDILMVATDLNAGLATPGTQKFAPAIADIGKDVLSLAAVADADKDQYGSVDVAITTAAGVSAAGTIAGYLTYVEGV
jgi:hypothetical protein